MTAWAHILSIALAVALLSAYAVTANEVVAPSPAINVPTTDLIGMVESASGAAGGAADNAAAFARIKPGRYVLSKSVCRVALEATVPAGVNLVPEAGSSISVDGGITLSIRGSVDPNVSQKIFTGAGAAVGITVNRPEWWNRCFAVADDASGCDSAPALNACFASAEAAYNPTDPRHPSDGARPTCQTSNRFYVIQTPIHMHPSGTMAEPLVGAGGINGGGWIRTGTHFPATGTLQIHGQPGGAGIFDFVLRDFQVVNGVGSKATCGICFNPEGAGHSINGVFARSLVENVGVYNFPIDWNIVNTLSVDFERVLAIGWTTTGATTVGFNFDTNNWFVGQLGKIADFFGVDGGSFEGAIIESNRYACSNCFASLVAAASTTKAIAVSNVRGAIKAGMLAIGGSGIPQGTTVTSVSKSKVILSNAVSIAASTNVNFYRSTPAIEVHGQSNAIGVFNNKCIKKQPLSATFGWYNALVQLDPDTDNASVGQNISFQCGANLTNNSAGAHNLIGPH